MWLLFCELKFIITTFSAASACDSGAYLSPKWWDALLSNNQAVEAGFLGRARRCRELMNIWISHSINVILPKPTSCNNNLCILFRAAEMKPTQNTSRLVRVF